MSPGSRPSQGRRPASRRMTPTTAIRRPKTISSLPTLSIIVFSFEEPALLRGLVLHGPAEVHVGVAAHPPAGRAAHQEADLQQVRLYQLGQRLRFVVDGGGHRLDAD